MVIIRKTDVSKVHKRKRSLRDLGERSTTENEKTRNEVYTEKTETDTRIKK